MANENLAEALKAARSNMCLLFGGALATAIARSENSLVEIDATLGWKLGTTAKHLMSLMSGDGGEVGLVEIAEIAWAVDCACYFNIQPRAVEEPVIEPEGDD